MNGTRRLSTWNTLINRPFSFTHSFVYVVSPVSIYISFVHSLYLFTFPPFIRAQSLFKGVELNNNIFFESFTHGEDFRKPCRESILLLAREGKSGVPF